MSSIVVPGIHSVFEQRHLRHRRLFSFLISAVHDIKSVHVSAERLRMMFKVRRTVRSGRKGSEWQGKRKLSMRGMAKDPLLIIKWAAVRKRCAEGEAPSIVGGSSW